MRRTIALAALVLAGCGTGSAPGSVPPARSPAIIGTGSDVEFIIPPDDDPAAAAIAAPPERVWDALLATYEALGLPVGTMDREAGIVGNTRVVLSRQLAGQPTTNFFSCGAGLGGGPNAGTYRIQLSVVSSVKAAPSGGSQLVTRTEATGTSGLGTSTAPTQCRSTGRLEQRIAKAVRDIVGTAPR